MPNDTGSNSALQTAIRHAMNALRTQGSLPEENVVLVTSLMLHRMQHHVGVWGRSSLNVWANIRDTNPIGAIDQILSEVERELTTRIERPALSATAARGLLQVIDGVYRAGSAVGDDAISIEQLEALGGTMESVSTPEAIASLMVEILDPRPACSIYDPAMGSGALLLASLNFVKNKDRNATLFPSGTERISRLVTLAKMNLALREYSGEGLTSGDAFARRSYEEGRPKYDYVISNPPVSQLESEHALLDLESHPAFVFGPPLRHADLNFIQLAVSCLKPGGSAVLLVRLRPLFASGKEQDIRKQLVEAGCVESVVALPERLLATTPAACAVLKLRAPIRDASIPPVKLIDASSEFEADERGKRILSRANIDRILVTISSDKVTDGLSILKIASDLSIHDYNLMPAKYLRSDDAQINLGENTVMRRIDAVADVLQGPSLGKRVPAGDTPVLQGRDVSRRTIYVEELHRKDVSSKSHSLVRAEMGDILVQRIGASPSACYVDRKLIGIPVSNTAYVVRLRERDEDIARFIAEFLNSPAGRKRLCSRAAGSTVPTLSKSALRAVEVPFADAAVVKLALELDDLQSALHEHLADAAGLKSQLFSISRPDQFVAAFRDLRRRYQSLKALKLDSESLVALNAAIGLAALEDAVAVWERDKDRGDEEFWHRVLIERPFLFAQLFHFPIVIIRDKAYVGGKRFDNAHGSIADFLAKTRTTGAALIIEVKTPCTRLLASPYRPEIYPWSSELSGALSQVLHYRSTLTQNILQLRAGVDEQLESDQPRCVVIAGDVSRELDTSPKRRSFERIRENLHGVSVIGFDELFGRAAGVLELLKNPT